MAPIFENKVISLTPTPKKKRYPQYLTKLSLPNQRHFHARQQTASSAQPAMLFKPAAVSLGKLRKSSHALGQPAVSLESVYLGRRRSLSLDDLGLGLPPVNMMQSPTSLPMMDDTDEDLDDLPSQEEAVVIASTDGGPTESSSLSTIREASPIHSVEEWSPSPADDEDNQSDEVCTTTGTTTIELRNNLVNNSNGSLVKSRSLPRGIQNYLAKWKNMIKK